MITIPTIIIKLYLAGWFITTFEPITKALDDFFSPRQDKLSEWIWDALGCQKCITFWLVLIFTFNPLWAIGASMIAELHKKISK